MIYRLTYFVLLLILSSGAFAQQINMASEISRLLRTDKLPQYFENSSVKQFSSYDRTGGNNDGFEGTYSFVRKNEDGSLVIFEAEGKGVIERIWTPTPTDDTLDFYFDGTNKASYSIKFRDLFSGKVYPFVNPVAGQNVGGWYSYLPMPFSNGCKIVLRGKKILFHQVQYRQYDDRSNVSNFTPELDSEAKRLLEDIVGQWKNTASLKTHHVSKPQAISRESAIKPGQTITLAQIRNAGRIVGIRLEPAELFEGLKNNFDLRITWDDEKIPAIYAPVADFFGYAFGEKSMNALLAGVNESTAYCYIPMPFDKNAKVELIYRKASDARDVKIKSTVHYTTEARNKASEGKFYAYWKREEPALGKPYVFLEGSGKGHLIGTLLLSQATSYEHFTEFFEGDDSTVLDNKHLIHGTGSEDYFNGGWYAQPGGWVERKGAPLHGCLDYSLPFSRTGGYRYYVSDKLPFQQSIYHSIEHGPVNNNRKVEYTSIAMYYADKPIAIGKAPTNSSSYIFIPDTITFYTRLMNHISYEGAAKLMNGSGELEQGQTGTLVIDTRELSKGTYKIFMHGRGAAGLNFHINNKNGKPETTSAKNEDPSRYSDVSFGTFTINDPNEPVRIYLAEGKNKLQFDRIFMVKQNQ